MRAVAYHPLYRFQLTKVRERLSDGGYAGALIALDGWRQGVGSTFMIWLPSINE